MPSGLLFKTNFLDSYRQTLSPHLKSIKKSDVLILVHTLPFNVFPLAKLYCPPILLGHLAPDHTLSFLTNQFTFSNSKSLS